MHIKIYEGGIMLPVKCGTRFLTHNNLKEVCESIDVSSLRKKFWIEGVKWMIVRNPIEGFHSALHTDVLHIVNTLNEGLDYVSSDSALYQRVSELLHSYNKWSNSEGHFHKNVYREMYWYWRRYHKVIRVIDLPNLNDFSKELGLYQSYDSKDYNFDWFTIWSDKESVCLWVKTNFPQYDSIINELMDETDGDMKWYNHLINGDVLPIKLI